MDLILDTNAVSAMLDGDGQVAAVLAAAGQIRIPAVVLGEYRFGLLQSTRRIDYERSLARAIARTGVLDVTEDTAPQYAEIRLELKRAGTPIPTNDLWIAALCRQHNYDLLSRDAHFDRVAGLRRIGW